MYTTFLSSFLGALIGGGLFYIIAVGYEKFTKREGLGGGDVKLMAMLGAFLGVNAILFIMVISSILGLIVGVIYMFVKKKDMHSSIPFGQFMCLAAYLYLFVGHHLHNSFNLFFIK